MQNRQNGQNDASMVGIYGGYLCREVYPKAVEMIRSGLLQEEVGRIHQRVRVKVGGAGYLGRLIGELQELTLSGSLRAPDGKRESIGLQVVELVGGQNCRENLAAFMDIMDAIGRRFTRLNRPAVEKLLVAYREWLGDGREGRALQAARERLESWLARKVATTNGNNRPPKTDDLVAKLRAEISRLKGEAAASFDADDRDSYRRGLKLELEVVDLEEKLEKLAGSQNVSEGGDA